MKIKYSFIIFFCFFASMLPHPSFAVLESCRHCETQRDLDCSALGPGYSYYKLSDFTTNIGYRLYHYDRTTGTIGGRIAGTKFCHQPPLNYFNPLGIVCTQPDVVSIGDYYAPEYVYMPTVIGDFICLNNDTACRNSFLDSSGSGPVSIQWDSSVFFDTLDVNVNTIANPSTGGLSNSADHGVCIRTPTRGVHMTSLPTAPSLPPPGAGCESTCYGQYGFTANVNAMSCEECKQNQEAECSTNPQTICLGYVRNSANQLVCALTGRYKLFNWQDFTSCQSCSNNGSSCNRAIVPTGTYCDGAVVLEPRQGNKKFCALVPDDDYNGTALYSGNGGPGTWTGGISRRRGSPIICSQVPNDTVYGTFCEIDAIPFTLDCPSRCADGPPTSPLFCASRRMPILGYKAAQREDSRYRDMCATAGPLRQSDFNYKTGIPNARDIEMIAPTP